jgi:hypothetical protein
MTITIQLHKLLTEVSNYLNRYLNRNLMTSREHFCNIDEYVLMVFITPTHPKYLLLCTPIYNGFDEIKIL